MFLFGYIPLPEIDTSAASEFDGHYSNYMLNREPHLYHILPEDRRTVYEYMKDKLKTDKEPLLKALVASYNDVSASIQQARRQSNTALIKQEDIEIIGCTCTGLLKYNDLITSLEPRIILMEEAAEVREADTMAAVAIPTLEQVILVGDHQQLRPHANMHELSQDPYRVDFSLFERLVKLVSHSTLLHQRRMIPRLRKVVQMFYPNLVDHESTWRLDQTIPGMSHQSLWWFKHNQAETMSLRSFANNFEACMIAGFVQYLVSQGVEPGKITMLTYYRGQVAALKLQLAATELPPFEWSVRTVDGFQGEENDIIILSLVRSPSGTGPGFCGP